MAQFTAGDKVKVTYEAMGGKLVAKAITKEGHVSWMWIVSLVIALALGVNLGVIAMALIQIGASEDQRRHVSRGRRP